MHLNEVVVKQGNEFVVMTKDRSRVLGRHASKEKAMSQLRAIEISKHRREDAVLSFSEFLSEQYASAHGKKLHIFDFDDTLAVTQGAVLVIRDGKPIKSLSSEQFKSYKLRPGEVFDLSGFEQVKNPTAIKQVFGILMNMVRAGSDVVVLTGRTKTESLKEWLRKYGVSISVVAVGRAESTASDIARMKRAWIEKKIQEEEYEIVEVFEDSRDNLDKIATLKTKFPNVKFILRSIGHHAHKVRRELGWV